MIDRRADPEMVRQHKKKTKRTAYFAIIGIAKLFHPLSIQNEVLDTESDDWGSVDYIAVGSEYIEHDGLKMTIRELEPVVRAKLAQYGSYEARQHGRQGAANETHQETVICERDKSCSYQVEQIP